MHEPMDESNIEPPKEDWKPWFPQVKFTLETPVGTLCFVGDQCFKSGEGRMEYFVPLNRLQCRNFAASV